MRRFSLVLSIIAMFFFALPTGAAPIGLPVPTVKTPAAQAQFGPSDGFGPPAGMMGQGNFGPGNGQGTQTCNINGVEIPGSCDQLQGLGSSGNFGPGGPGQGSGPNQGQGFNPGSGVNGNGSGNGGMMNPDGEGNFGPSEEQIQKMQIQGMFQGAKMAARGMGQGMKMMKSMFPKLEKQGIAIPQELRDAMKSADGFVAYMKNIKTADDIPDADVFMDKMSEMADTGSVLQEWGPQLGNLLRMGQMIKEADKRIKQVDAGVKKAKTQAAKSKVDLSSIIADLDTNVAAARQALTDAKAKTDPDEKQDAIETFFDSVQNVFDTMKLIDDLKNIGKAKTNWTRQVKQNDTLLKQLQKRKLNTGELAAKQGEVKAKLTELEQALKQKPIDQETVVGIFDEVKDLQAEFGDLRDTLIGTQSELPQIKADPYKAPSLDFGAFEQFKKQAPEATSEADDEAAVD